MRQATGTFEITTRGAGLYDVTANVADFVRTQTVKDGLVTLFIRHTSASLVIQENADPSVLEDLNEFFARIAPADGRYRHDSEGADDMPAHIKAALTQTSLSIPVMGGALTLGTWQGIYVFEHRDRAHRRTVALHLLGI